MTYDSALSVEEKVASLFQPDTLLPAQYFETFRRKAHLEPEKRLMLAILEDAIACYQKYFAARDGRGKAIFRDTEHWISDRESEWIFSFENICDVLGFDPDYIRGGLTRWKEMTTAKRPKAKIYRLPSRKEGRKRRFGVSRQGQKMFKVAGR